MADTGGNAIRQNDVRNILRRGTGEGYAEVIFKAVDGHRYISRWVVKRAYGKASGSLQQQQMQVKDADTGEEVQGKKTELLGRLVQLTGLTYEQFTRTVLLAQNDFATFLKSKEKAKAELLEKLTGTGLYSRISEEIYRRSKSADQEVERLEMQMGSIETLTPEQHEKCSAEKAAFEQEMEELSAGLKVIKEKLEWYRVKEELQQRIRQAEAEYRQVEEELAAAAPCFDRLTRIENAAEARPVVQHLETVTAALHSVSTREEVIRQQLAGCRQELEKTIPLHAEWEKRNIAFGEYKKGVEEKLQTARVLDAALELKKREHAGAVKELEQLAAEQANYTARYTAGREQLMERLSQMVASLELPLPEKPGMKIYRQVAERLQQKREQTGNRIAGLQEQNRERQSRLEGYRIEELARQQEDLLRRKEELEKAGAGFQQWLRIKKELTAVQETGKELQQQARKLEEERAATALQLEEVNRMVERVRRLYETAKFAASEGASSIREKMNREEPCPVCGSTHHPYLTEGQQVDHLYREVEKEYRHAVAEQQAVANRHNLLLAGLQSLEQQQAAKQKEEIRFREEEKKHCPATEQERTESFYETALVALSAGLAGIHRQREAYHHLLKEWQAVDKEIKLLQEEVRIVDGHLHQSAVLVEQVLSVKGQLDMVEQRRQKQKEALEAMETQLREIQQQSHRLLESKSIGEAEQLLASQERELTQGLEDGRKKLEEAQRLLSGREGEFRQLQHNKQEQAQRLEQARNELREWLDRYNRNHAEPLGEEALQELLAVPLQWINRQKEERGRLNERRVAAVATLTDRKARLEQHRAVPAKPDPEQEPATLLETRLQELEQRYAGVEKRSLEIRLQLQRHQENIRQLAGIETERNRLRAIAAKWGKLNDLFGSASGDKFKVIAQGYTLKVLLLHANKHLEYLSTRYRLQQVPDTLALQVIDRDMCDEVRTVYSLSGGESFLISLALALGLSSLSSNNLCVESLFIDEGFGSLDSDSLRMAMDALEQLRMQGRKIGVISHVQEMRERITTQVILQKSVNGRSRIVIK